MRVLEWPRLPGLGLMLAALGSIVPAFVAGDGYRYREHQRDCVCCYCGTDPGRRPLERGSAGLEHALDFELSEGLVDRDGLLIEYLVRWDHDLVEVEFLNLTGYELDFGFFVDGVQDECDGQLNERVWLAPYGTQTVHVQPWCPSSNLLRVVLTDVIPLGDREDARCTEVPSVDDPHAWRIFPVDGDRCDGLYEVERWDDPHPARWCDRDRPFTPVGS